MITLIEHINEKIINIEIASSIFYDFLIIKASIDQVNNLSI